VIGSDNLCGLEEKVPPNEHVDNRAPTPEATPRVLCHRRSRRKMAKMRLRRQASAKSHIRQTASPRTQLFFSTSECSSPAAAASRRRRQQSSVRMKLIIFTPFFCSTAECLSLAATASRGR
jgi:hypothetical protein